MKFLSTTICVLLLLNVSHAQILSENPADGLLCINGAIPFWTACDEDKCADTSYYTNGAIKLIGSCGNGIKDPHEAYFDL